MMVYSCKGFVMNDDQDPGSNQNGWMKNMLIWAGVIIGLLVVVSLIDTRGSADRGSSISYSTFRDRVADGQVKNVVISSDRVTGTYVNDEKFSAVRVENDPTLIPLLEEKGVDYSGKAIEQPSLLVAILFQSLPFILIIAIAFFVLRQVQKGGGASGAMGFGKSKAKLLTEKAGKVTFADVAGIDEAREELQEIVEFLRDPSRFSKLGGQIPKGALLVGSPGTGKTLLARAKIGRAHV